MKWMFTCSDATFLSDISQYRKLRVSEKLKFFSHLMMCWRCKNYHKHNAILTEALDVMLKENSKDKMRSETKAKITQEINEVLNN